MLHHMLGGGGGALTPFSPALLLAAPPLEAMCTCSFFVRMFFNPPFTKSSHVASVLCECLEMASRRCGLLAGLCAPLVLLALVSPVCVYRAPCPGGGGGGGGGEGRGHIAMVLQAAPGEDDLPPPGPPRHTSGAA